MLAREGYQLTARMLISLDVEIRRQLDARRKGVNGIVI
jgi:hypothetical protein